MEAGERMNEADHAAAIQSHVSGDLVEAERGYRRLIAQGSTQSVIFANLAALCIESGRGEEGRDLALRAIQLEPRNAGAHRNLAIASSALGDHEAAIAAFTKAAALEPNNADNLLNLATLYSDRRRLNEAEAAFRRLIDVHPQHFRAHLDLAALLFSTGRVDEAIVHFEQAIALKPNSPAALLNTAVALQFRGRLADSLPYIRRVLAANPRYQPAHNNLIYTLSFGQLAAPEEILAAARAFEAAVCPPESVDVRSRAIPTNRKINVGILSAELRGNHPIPYFLETYLRHYDRDRFSVRLYPTTTSTDKRRGELLALVDGSRELTGIDDAQAKALIMGDAIDILLDTTGHLNDSRLPLLASRCAPIQCHYIGFHGSTGIRAMDYFIGDAEITPPEHAGHFSEDIMRLGRLWVAYTAPDDAPTPRQESPDDQVCLGSFNNLNKVTDETLALWSAALLAVPDAKLVLKDPKAGDDFSKRRIFAKLMAEGVAGERIVFLENVPKWADHMRLYNRIDVALDTVPLNGGTTTFDALFMGTPVVTVRGNWVGGRLSGAMLVALGHPEWIAETPTAFAGVVAGLVADKRKLKRYKDTLRAEVLASELCDGPSLAQALEDAFGQAIERHNRGLSGSAG